MTPTAPPATVGVALVVLATALFASGDNLVKLTGAYLPVVLLIWIRYAVQAGLMALWLAPQGLRRLRTAHPRFQLGRGVLLLGTSAMSFAGLQRMPVAEFTALGMLTPVVVTLLAASFGERVSALRWALVWGGFAGALIVIRPGAGVFGAAAIFPLAMALCYGGFQLLTSRLAGLESPYLTHFWTGFVGLTVATPLVAAHWPATTAALAAAPGSRIALAFAVGGFATFGHLALIFAFQRASIATLMPVIYAQIGFALAAGWVLFRHVPDGWAWIGIGVIAVCGAFSAWLNARSRDAAAGPASVIAADTVYD